jgi:hypothetical protein
MGLMKRLSAGGRGGSGSGGLNLYAKFQMQMNPGAVLQLGKQFTSDFTKGVGAYVMTAARSSLRPGRKQAEPGRPPHTHSSPSPLKHGIFFATEPNTVVVGPVALESKKYQGVTGARLLEEGGTRVVRWPGGRTKTQRYRAFPYMAPALKKGLADYIRKTGNSAPRAIVGPRT